MHPPAGSKLIQLTGGFESVGLWFIRPLSNLVVLKYEVIHQLISPK